MADVARPGRRCPKGHAMDPNWDTCSYCEAEEKASQRSVGAQGGSDAADRQRTMVGSARPATPEPQRVTRAVGEPARPGGYGAPVRRAGSPGSRHVLLAAGGRDLPVREGKNFIGSGDVSSESAHRVCDIHIPHDNMMSGEHALILCRGATTRSSIRSAPTGRSSADKCSRPTRGTTCRTTRRSRRAPRRGPSSGCSASRHRRRPGAGPGASAGAAYAAANAPHDKTKVD